MDVKGSTRNGSDPKCPSARHLRIFQEDIVGPTERANCTWMTADQALAVRVHFLRWGGLLNEWSVEGVMSLVFV
ncbi:hypothetical protein TNCV_290891 [Trichonephila clavipes]|nr:hypothetical protein TNCV_290891 [Trichonephila clavipes]